jgi:Pyruvate/2-oxoacid:ferredoxin oxidoreductase delta subunit
VVSPARPVSPSATSRRSARVWSIEKLSIHTVLFVAPASTAIVGINWAVGMWCRFGCPMAAPLGLVQKLGRFRITVERDMCISCGNCWTYCEMGIDVRAYAQANLDVKRAACVGSSMCAHVCLRGLLRLEVKPDRFKVGRRYECTRLTCRPELLRVSARSCARIGQPRTWQVLNPGG